MRSLNSPDCRQEVATIEEMLPPRPFDREAREILRIEGDDGSGKLGLEGEGEIIGIADTGLDDGHPGFPGPHRGNCRARPAWSAGRLQRSKGARHSCRRVRARRRQQVGRAGEGAAPKARLFFQSILDLAAEGLAGCRLT